MPRAKDTKVNCYCTTCSTATAGFTPQWPATAHDHYHRDAQAAAKGAKIRSAGASSKKSKRSKQPKDSHLAAAPVPGHAGPSTHGRYSRGPAPYPSPLYPSSSSTRHPFGGPIGGRTDRCDDLSGLSDSGRNPRSDYHALDGRASGWHAPRSSAHDDILMEDQGDGSEWRPMYGLFAAEDGTRYPSFKAQDAVTAEGDESEEDWTCLPKETAEDSEEVGPSWAPRSAGARSSSGAHDSGLIDLDDVPGGVPEDTLDALDFDLEHFASLDLPPSPSDKSASEDPKHFGLPSYERMAYINATHQLVNGLSITKVEQCLRNARAMSESTLKRELPDFATQVRPAMSRLGVDPEAYMHRYAVCSQKTCCYLVPMAELKRYNEVAGHLTSEGRECTGDMFRIRGKTRRPLRVLAYSPVSKMLQLFLRDPTFVEQLQTWRGDEPDDQIGVSRPTRYRDPNRLMTSIVDGFEWRARASNSERKIHDDRVEDLINGPPQRLVNLEFGIQAAINLDWFTVKGIKKCSMGGLYVTFLNLPRHLFSRRSFTVLALAIPGPSEPSLLALNRVLEPLIKDLQSMELGFDAEVYGRTGKVEVKVQTLLTSSDMPATRKLTGSMSHASHAPCNHCNISLADLKNHTAFKFWECESDSPQLLLNQAARHLSASPAGQRAIEAESGLRWSEMVRLRGFEHSKFCPPDTMHGAALGTTHGLVVWLIRSGILGETPGQPKNGEPAPLNPYLAKFRDVLSGFVWPSHVGRLVPDVVDQVMRSKAANNIKADEWNRIRVVLPTALWEALRDESTGEITAATGPGCTFTTSATRLVFQAVVDFTASLRILLARSITPALALEAQYILSRASATLQNHQMPTSINWHMTSHYYEFILRYGPVGTWSTFAYERNNGVLARTSYAKGNTVQMTSTAMRRWIREQLLRFVVSTLAPDADQFERAWATAFAAEMDQGQAKGTLLLEEQRAGMATRLIKLPKSVGAFAIEREELYMPTIDYLNSVRGIPTTDPGNRIRSVNAWQQPGIALETTGHVKLPHVRFNGFKLNSSFYDGRTSRMRDRYAIARNSRGERIPCEIVHFYKIGLPEGVKDVKEEQTVVAGVRFFKAAEYPGLPWEERASMMSQRLVKPSDKITIIPVTDLLAPVAIRRIDQVKGVAGQYFVIISYEKDEIEYNHDKHKQPTITRRTVMGTALEVVDANGDDVPVPEESVVNDASWAARGYSCQHSQLY